MNNITTLFLITLLCFTHQIEAQKFLRPFSGFSEKKPAYITMSDGKEMVCTIEKFKYKKGLIDELYVREDGGKKKEIDLTKVRYAYFPQSGLDKLYKLDDFLVDATQWESGLHDMDRIKDGYAYFESVKCQVKKNIIQTLVQQLNPGTSTVIKVFENPYATESFAPSVGGIQVAGGDDKSYYVQKGNAPAYLLSKKDFKKSKDIFSGCDNFSNKFPELKWSDFEEAVFFYNANCQN